MSAVTDPPRRLVAVRVGPRLDLLRVLEDAWERGEAVLPLPSSWPDEVVGSVLDELRPTAVRTGAGDVPLAGGEPVAAEVALVVTTSGATGRPKGVELTDGALEHAVGASLGRLGAAAGDRWLCCLPRHHIAGVLVLLRARASGTEPIVHPWFDPERIATETRATHVSLVPTMLGRLLDAGVDLGRFVSILLGGAPARAELLERAADAGARVITTYGMTETCGGCVYDGVPIDGVEVELRAHEASPDGGRIAVRGPTVMRGYRRRPELTLEVLGDGWLTTPDLGRWDEDGRLEVTGRVDDVIVTGGENVSGSRVARLLAEHPKVAEAAVHGRPDAGWGEVVVAMCVATDPADPPRLDELRAHVTAAAPTYAAPRELVLVEALPRTALGKVRRPPGTVGGGPDDDRNGHGGSTRRGSGLAGPPPDGGRDART